MRWIGYIVWIVNGFASAADFDSDHLYEVAGKLDVQIYDKVPATISVGLNEASDPGVLFWGTPKDRPLHALAIFQTQKVTETDTHRESVSVTYQLPGVEYHVIDLLKYRRVVKGKNVAGSFTAMLLSIHLKLVEDRSNGHGFHYVGSIGEYEVVRRNQQAVAPEARQLIKVDPWHDVSPAEIKSICQITIGRLLLYLETSRK